MSTSVGRVALVTCQPARGLDADEPLLLAALDDLDVTVDVLDWDGPSDWSTYDAVVVRSTWDYPRRHADFLRWASGVDEVTQLHNPASMLAWNTDKRYLTQLAEAGLAVIQTTFLTPGRDWTVTELADAVVVKPAVSAGAQDTARYEVDELPHARAHIARLHEQRRLVMVQPYVSGIDEYDETALVYIGGVFSHAAAKASLLGAGAAESGLFATEKITPRTPSDAERLLGDAAMAWLAGSTFGTPLYARIDLLPDSAGDPLILEVELTEPSLFLETDSAAADRLAAAIRRLIV